MAAHLLDICANYYIIYFHYLGILAKLPQPDTYHYGKLIYTYKQN